LIQRSGFTKMPSVKRTLVFVLFFPLLVSCGNKDTIIQSLYDISGAPLVYDDSGATKTLHVAAVCMVPGKESEK